MRKSSSGSPDSYKILYGTCPDEQCKAKLYFPSYDKSIECTNCGQRHEKSAIKNVAEVTNPKVALHNILKNILLGNVKPKKGADNVKVLGLSNYVCKIVSPILTKYGMDKNTGSAKLLSELGQPAVLDCGKILGDRAFLIEEENLDIIGYGKDRTGSAHYLSDTLKVIRIANDNETRLVPIHADGDGHCLVHAVSRALVGRELFWHGLRVNLMHHFQSKLTTYKDLFRDFIDVDEWEAIINECDPDFVPQDGEPLGLRNIHVFGLANVLRRPIILLDSISGIESSGDYSGVFLPGLLPPNECKGRDGVLNKPLCIAWSSMGRNHYIPLVGIKGKEQPLLPRDMIQRAWGLPSMQIDKYMDFSENGSCVIGGNKCLSDKYIRTLVSAMEKVYMDKYGVHPQLVADTHQYLYRTLGMVGARMEEVLKTTREAIQRKTLYRCLTCEAIMEYQLHEEWFQKGGSLYNLAVKTHGKLKSDKKYSFPQQGAVCSYDKDQDKLVPDPGRCKPSTCTYCQGENVRLVNGDGSVCYENGDRTNTPAVTSRCMCGFKHFWDGKEYDNLPEIFPISMEWNGEVVTEKVVWFQYESDITLNSNVFEVAHKLVQKHFPGEFGSERLVQRVVDTILRHTAPKVKDKEGASTSVVSPYQDTEWSAEEPSKIILTGHKQKTLHKEELTVSQKEKMVKKQIETQAPKQQQKKSQELAAAGSKSSPSKPKVETVQRKELSPVPMETDKSSSHKKIRVATSDGRQVMLSVEGQVNFDTLQNMIYKAVKVPPERQRIRIGFPPKELKRPSDSDINEPIPLSHGDKISLEIIPLTHSLSESGAESSHKQEHKALKHSSSSPAKSKQHWSSFEEDIHSNSFEPLLHSFHEHAGNTSNSLDAAVASLTIMATLKGRDLWTHVQTMPHLFSVGGLFYKQVERDLGLVDGKHCTLPTLPGKVFRYNQPENRLELCMEPYGHFPIEPDVENRAKETRPIFGSRSEGSFSAFSGAVGQEKSKQAAFTGQGHSLKSMPDIERMPEDIPENIHHHARHSHTLCNPYVHQESIAEEPEDQSVAEVEKTKGGGDRKAKHHRMGPGYSVIDHSNVNRTNQSIQQFKDLAESIERTMHEEISKIDEEMEKLDEEEEEKKSRTSSVGSSHTPGNHDDAKTTQDTSPSDTTDNMCSVTSEAMEVTGSEEGRQLPTMADDQVTEPGQTMDEQ